MPMVTVPGQLRRYVAKEMAPTTSAGWDLRTTCRREVERLEYAGKSFLVTSDIELSNDALGVALDIAREWLNSSNGNNQRAGQSFLKAHELDYRPDDPRETRTQIKAPKSLAGMYQDEIKNLSASGAMKADIAGLNWGTGISGRVRPETLAWLMERARYWGRSHPTPSIQRSARKFVDTYGETHESLQRLINGYLGTGEEDQAPEEEEAPASEPKRLILVACGGKKLDTDRAAAGEMYVGSYHKACRKAADALGDWVMVLSAKYGLVGLDDEIDAYDVRVNDPDAITPEELAKQALDLEILDADVTVLGGSDYVKLASRVWNVNAPLSGGIGQQLKQLAEIYKGEALDDDEDQEPDEVEAAVVEDEPQEEDGPVSHYKGELRNVGSLPGLHRAETRVLWFGGKAGKKHPEPGTWRKAEIVYTGEGKYDICALGTEEVLLTASLTSQIHWSPLDTPEVEPAKDEPAVESGEYEVPANFLELAAEANTEAARRYWTRRCEEYKRTGE
ncbi:DUF6884 domain-containing protein [Streptomyces sp. NPDC002698]|uniref:DUF6884 domain-containing protein n=1 Tax=Streptomyces sp. NPDC002698 TaxID=3364660 RepID=UPI0036BE8B9D